MVKKLRFPPTPKGEVASILTNPYEQHYFRLGDDLVLQPNDEILLAKGGISALKVYQRLQTDANVQAALNKLYQEIISRDIIVEPVSDKEGDIYVAEFVERCLTKFLSFDTITRGFLEAKILGFKVGEVIWENSKAGVIPVDIKMRDGRRFVYVKNVKTNELSIRMRTDVDWLIGDKLPPRKFLSFRYWAFNNSDEYGCGLGKVLYPIVKFKRRAQESELIFSDRYATPHALITAPLNALKSEIDAVYTVFSNLSQETALILPEGFTAEFIEPKGKVEIFTNIKESYIRDINILLCGENEVGQIDAGSKASSETASSLRVTMAKEMSELIHEFFQKTLIRWIVDLNFGLDVETPKVHRDFADEERSSLTAQDLKTLHEEFNHLPRKDWIERNYNIEFEEEEEIDIEEEAIEKDKVIYDPNTMDIRSYLMGK
ncbi:MAG: DUF935 family protein [Nitrososphaeraceae archaeon]|nr:DUF935 family protein [Nitrososphaeraceae archaeon]